MESMLMKVSWCCHCCVYACPPSCPLVVLGWWWSCAFADVRWERELGNKSHETECDGLISGATM